MLIQPAPLYETAQGLRSGAIDLLEYIHQTCNRMEDVDL